MIGKFNSSYRNEIGVTAGKYVGLGAGLKRVMCGLGFDRKSCDAVRELCIFPHHLSSVPRKLDGNGSKMFVLQVHLTESLLIKAARI